LFYCHKDRAPDEFHDGYPDAAMPGLNNNAYTNIMAVWVLCRAMEVLDLLSDVRRGELTTRLGISSEEIARWNDISLKMYVPFHDDGIISQFEGYDTLREFDWQNYRTRYGNIQRLDLILEAENDSPNRYKLSKQADVVMLFYLFSSEELGELFTRLGYLLKYDTIPKTVTYYAARSSYGSTLGRVVYSWVLARSDRPRSMTFFAEALQSDVTDIQQGTTSEGVHLGAMAGTVDLVQRVSTGIEVRTTFYGSIRNCLRKSSASTCASAIEDIRSICSLRATPSQSVGMIARWRRFPCAWQEKSTNLWAAPPASSN
jgi:trehalose/maltose hydrolase-like predicted phosphorylase